MTPSQKILVIERSLRGFRYALFSLIPLVGIVMGILAFREIRLVRRICSNEWNPAQNRATLGKIVASIGLSISILLVCFVILAIVMESIPESEFDDYDS